jgi:hypothetical protein
VTRIRWAPLSGVAFAILFGVAAGLYGSGAGNRSADVAVYYADGSNRARQLAGFAVLLAGLAFFAWFVSVLADAVQRNRSLVLVAGCVTTLGLVAANVLWAASSATIELEPRYTIDPRTHLALEDTGFLFLVSALVSAAAFVLAASTGRAFPRWFAWLGVPTALACLAGWWYFPIFVLLAWVVGAAILLARRGTRKASVGSAG